MIRRWTAWLLRTMAALACAWVTLTAAQTVQPDPPRLGVFYFPGWKEGALGLAYPRPWEPIKRYPEREPQLIGIRENRVTTAPLMQCVADTQAVAEAIKAHDYERAMTLRGGSFSEAFRTLRTIVQTRPSEPGARPSPRSIRPGD